MKKYLSIFTATLLMLASCELLKAEELSQHGSGSQQAEIHVVGDEARVVETLASLEIINNYGGDMGETYGVPVEEIQRGIQHGVRKINVDTDNRLAITGAIRKVLAEDPEKFDPRDYLKPAREAMKQVCVDRMTSFGQAGNASHIRQTVGT